MTKPGVRVLDSHVKKMLIIGSVSIPYEFIRSSKNKYIRVGISTNGVRVTAPYGVNFSEIEGFLDKKSDWIKKHYIRFQSINNDKKIRAWDNGEKILYLGNEYNIRITDYDRKRTTVKFTSNEFEVYVNNSISGVERTGSMENAFRNWFIDRAREIITVRLELISRLTGLKYNTFRIKEQKTRWGSCSRKGNLNFNWKIVMAPLWVADYVILHEVCHLKHLNHSKKFWDMVIRYNPDYRKAEEWLKTNIPGL